MAAAAAPTDPYDFPYYGYGPYGYGPYGNAKPNSPPATAGLANCTPCIPVSVKDVTHRMAYFADTSLPESFHSAGSYDYGYGYGYAPSDSYFGFGGQPPQADWPDQILQREPPLLKETTQTEQAK